MADLDSLIGCKISLISHQDVRYDGNLFSINQAESSIVLKDVQVFGTEDRITDPSKIVAASVALIPFVTFPGSEIKDLYVHENSAAAPTTAKPEEPVLPTPAPAPAGPTKDNKPPRQQQHHKNDHHNNNNNNNSHNQQRDHHAQPPKAPTPQEEKKAHTESNTQQQQQQSQQGGNNTSGSQNKSHYTTAGTGSHLLKMREKKAHGSAAAGGAATTDKSEFDFQESNTHFKKDEVFANVSETKPVVQKYNKADFFDNISNDAAPAPPSEGNEGIPARKNRLSASEERQLNQDTFGAIALTTGYRGRGRGGRGRGGRGNYNNNNNGGGNNGRGGGRGGGRGYYNNRNRNNNSNNNNNNNNNNLPRAEKA